MYVYHCMHIRYTIHTCIHSIYIYIHTYSIFVCNYIIIYFIYIYVLHMCSQCWLQGLVQISILTGPEAYTASSLVNFWRWNFHPKFLGSARAEHARSMGVTSRNGDGSNPCTVGEHQKTVVINVHPQKHVVFSHICIQMHMMNLSAKQCWMYIETQ